MFRVVLLRGFVCILMPRIISCIMLPSYAHTMHASKTIGFVYIFFQHTDRQLLNGTDCGVYSIANVVEFMDRDGNPTKKYQSDHMRAHLMTCVEKGEFTLFPEGRKRMKGRVGGVKELSLTS